MTHSHLPRHIAIIMDGNGRWAKKRKLPRFMGHKAGVESVRNIVKYCGKHGIEVLTLFAFSSENWRRPKEEVSLLMQLFINVLQQEVKKLHANNVRLKVIGEKSAFSDKLQTAITNAEKLTKDNTGLTVVIAANYGGHWDITEAAKKLAQKVENGQLKVEDITEDKLGQEMCLSSLPAPDLFIRTGGEQRISNFLLWQLAYAEMYFTDIPWPDFDDTALETALKSFTKRERRFGQTSEQVSTQKDA